MLTKAHRTHWGDLVKVRQLDALTREELCLLGDRPT
jgi:hypothetical protein